MPLPYDNVLHKKQHLPFIGVVSFYFVFELFLYAISLSCVSLKLPKDILDHLF